MKTLKLIRVLSILPLLVSLSRPASAADESAPQGTTEWELNAPVDNTDGLTPETSADEPTVGARDNQTYFFPTWKADYGISRKMFDRAKKYYDQYWKTFENRRYVVIIDMGLHSSKKRFVLFDLKNGTFERHNTSHGSGSDPNADGWADSYSNSSGSNKTSLGFYKTLYTYNGKHGRSLRLDGLESTNNNALARAIVVHGASYISNKKSTAGRSWGCPALDNAVVQTVIDKIKGGGMLLIATSR